MVELGSAASGDDGVSLQALAATLESWNLLVIATGNGSHLVLDPDLDSFYVMDTVVTKVPGLLVAVAAFETDLRAAEAATAATGQVETQTSASLAVDEGTITSLGGLMLAGLQTSYEQTASADLQTALEPVASQAADLDGTTVAGADAPTDVAASTTASPASSTAAAVSLAQLGDAAADELDALLQTRLDGMQRELAVAWSAPRW